MFEYNLDRFSLAHERDYDTALSEIQSGRKVSHWMWYIFPQLKGLGRSTTSEYYGINNLDEAKAFLNDKYLGDHLLEITSALLSLDCNDARIVMGRPDDMKLKSSMTLFCVAAPQEKVFFKVLEKYFNGQPDYRTLKKLGVHKGTAADSQSRSSVDNSTDRIIRIEDDNIRSLRKRYPNGFII